MVNCAVNKCKNKSENVGEKISFHRFPKDAEVVKVWYQFCDRSDHQDTRNWRICSIHFERDQFENTVKFGLGYARALKVKRNAVPTLHPPPGKRDKGTGSNDVRVYMMSDSGKIYNLELMSLKHENNLLKQLNAGLANENFTLKVKNNKAEQEIESLRRKLCASELEIVALKKKFPKLDRNQTNIGTESTGGAERVDDFEMKLPLYYIDNARFPDSQNSSQLERDFKIEIIPDIDAAEVKSEPAD